MNAELERHGWTVRKYERGDAEMLWESMADDARCEFAQEGFDSFDSFVMDIELSDHIETWLLDGKIVCAFWAGWNDDFTSRAFGCSVVGPSKIDRKYRVARDSKLVVDDFMSREPSSIGDFVLIPEWAERLVRHASRMAGLEMVGAVSLDTGYYNVFKWNGGSR